ncbi:MAG: hypothetical protein EZS28_003171, partial [Streblomastix strix]
EDRLKRNMALFEKNLFGANELGNAVRLNPRAKLQGIHW